MPHVVLAGQQQLGRLWLLLVFPLATGLWQLVSGLWRLWTRRVLITLVTLIRLSS
jgi:hypothetical protein